MSTYGLSTLEIKHIIERALLPDQCECEISDGLLKVSLRSHPDGFAKVLIREVKLDSLLSSRAIAELVGAVRKKLAYQNSDHLKIAYKQLNT